MAATKCSQCSEIVYPLERMVFAEKVFHKGCAKCSHCQGTLTISSFASANGKLFCKPHYLELFKSSGGKYAFAGQAESNNIVERGQVVSEPVKAPKAKVKPSDNKMDTIKKPETKKEVNGPPKIASKLSAFLQAASSNVAAPDEKPSNSIDLVPPKNEDIITKEVKPTVKAASNMPERVKPTAPANVNQAKPANRLAAFLAGANVNEPAEVIEAADEHVEEVVSKPQETGVLPASVPAPAGISKLSWFLQNVEGPAVTPTITEAFRVQDTPVEPVPKSVEPEAQMSVSELVKKVEEPVQKPVEVAAKNAAVAVTPQIDSVDTENASLVSNSLRERLNQVKKPFKVVSAEQELIERLQGEIAQWKAKCGSLEEEVATLTARIEHTDAGKEALAKEVARLNSALNMYTKSPTKATKSLLLETNENQMVENSLRHAKKLLAQGKITKSQYEAAARACIEASRALAQ